VDFLGLKAPGAAINDHAVPGNESLFPVSQMAHMRTVVIGAFFPHWVHWVDAASLVGMLRLEGFEPPHDIVGESCSPLRCTRLDSDLPESVLYCVGCSDSHARSQ